MVNGTIYITTPDNAWALNAHDGSELWHYYWKTRGGTHIANRGFGMWNNYLYMETPDNYLVSLEAKTGKERWHKVIADFNQQYFSTTAPMVMGNHVLAGTGNDLDSPGFLQSFDPETGELQWKFYTVPMKQGDPGLETWENLNAAQHGGAQPWLPGVYDPETKLYIFGTGNPTPAYTAGRGEGDNLFTCSLIAVNVDTGKMAWYFQTSPHDMHDWDSAQTPILIDATVNGQAAQARLDRRAQRLLLHTRPRHRRASGHQQIWDEYQLGEGGGEERLAAARSGEGSVDRRRSGFPQRRGDDQLGTARLLPGHRALLCPGAQQLLDFLLDGSRSARLDGSRRHRTGADRIRRQLPHGDRTARPAKSPGVVPIRAAAAAGAAVSSPPPAVSSSAAMRPATSLRHDAKAGKPLWHSRIGGVTNAPQTYMLDGKQYLLVAAGDTLYSFTLY